MKFIDKDCKEFIIIILSGIKENRFSMNERLGGHSRKIESIHILKKQTEILELNKTIPKIKNSVDGINSAVEVIEERVIKRNYPIYRRQKKDGGKMNRD